jgi:hypothetical protein
VAKAETDLQVGVGKPPSRFNKAVGSKSASTSFTATKTPSITPSKSRSSTKTPSSSASSSHTASGSRSYTSSITASGSATGTPSETSSATVPHPRHLQHLPRHPRLPRVHLLVQRRVKQQARAACDPSYLRTREHRSSLGPAHRHLQQHAHHMNSPRYKCICC